MLDTRFGTDGVLNVTGTEPTAGTHVIVFPSGVARPNTSSLNLVPGETRANQVTVALGADRKVSPYNNAGSANVIVDITGFYTPDYGATFLPLTPTRLLDTRTGAGSPVGPGAEIEVLNLTGVDATASTFVSAWGP